MFRYLIKSIDSKYVKTKQNNLIIIIIILFNLIDIFFSQFKYKYDFSMFVLFDIHEAIEIFVANFPVKCEFKHYWISFQVYINDNGRTSGVTPIVFSGKWSLSFS